jgi:hypothetical protein
MPRRLFPDLHARVLPLSVLALGVTACFIGDPPPAVGAEPSTELESMIQTKADAQAPGAERVGDLLRGVGKDEGERADFKVPLQEGACYAIIAAGDPTVSGLTLSIWDKHTFRAGHDAADGREAFVELCAEHSAEYQVQGKIGGGAGHFAIAVFKKSGGGPETAGGAPPVTNEADIEKVIKDDAKSAAADAKQLGGFYTAKDGKNDYYVELQKDVCYWFIARGTADRDFKLTLWDGRNGRIDQIDASGGRAQVAHCAGEKNMYHVQVKTSGEGGAVKLGVFSSASKAGGGGKVDADLEKTIREEAKTAAPQARQVGGFHSATGKKTNFFVELQEGRCYWIIAAGGPDTDDFTLYAWSHDSRRLAEKRDIKRKGQIGHCAQESGMYKFEVKLDDPADKVAVGGFGK